MPFRIVAILFHASPLSDVPSLLLLHSLSVISVLGGAIFIFFTPAPSVSLGRLSMPSSPESPEGPRSSSARHSYGAVKVPSAAFFVPATGSQPCVPGVAVFYLATEPRHLASLTATPPIAGFSAPHTRARPDPYLAMIRPSNLWNSCKIIVRDELRRSKIGSEWGPRSNPPRGYFHTSHPDPRVA